MVSGSERDTGTSTSMPVGAEIAANGTRFRVWAPCRKQVEVVLEGKTKGEEHIVALKSENNGYFSGMVEGAGPGSRYWYRLDAQQGLTPDPASRFQPDGPHGPSEVIDHRAFHWTDGEWNGKSLRGQVLYEMHCGTFTAEGTWAAAAKELEELARLGITVLEVMPVGEFPGHFGWGYDGVHLFAPYHHYGRPDDFRRFIDHAHRVGLAVILDVVYNHVGPDGNCFREFSPYYFTKKYSTDWGDPFNFDGEHSGPVREFFLANASYWIREFHLDGLRIDATQNIYDEGSDHILAAVTRAVRETAGTRSTIVIAENEPNDVRMVRPPWRDSGGKDGFGMDGLWNDDFHHSALVALTGVREAYFTDYRGEPKEFVAAMKHGYLYQGQRYTWQKKPRGTPAFGVPPEAFVTFIENHDQIPNAGLGRRVHSVAAHGQYRALTALMLLGPGTPMLFQGQEFSASSPFHYFADHVPKIAVRVHAGRKKFLSQFRSSATEDVQAVIPDPADPRVFESSKLDFSERQSHAEAYALHRNLLRLRRESKAFREQRAGGVDGAVLASHAFVIRFFERENDDRLLLVNLGAEISLEICPEPLVAPVRGKKWRIIWSSEDTEYGGRGRPPLELENNWCLPANAALVLAGVES